MTKLKNTLLALSVIGLQACGGGGGGDSTPALSLDSVQGVYDTTAYSGSGLGAATQAVRAVVLRDGSTWLFLMDGLAAANPAPVGLAKANVTVSGQTFSGTGKRYMLADGSASNLAVSGSVPAASTLGLSFSDSAGGTTSATSTVGAVSRFNALAAKADMAADWTFSATQPTVGGGSVSVTWNWSVDANGTLSGSNSLGCSFTGTVLPRSETVAVFDATINESCAGTTRIFNGLAFQNSAHTLTTFGLILNDGSSATVAVATKVVPT
ncbi:MAG: hypothetical protein PHW25_13810 [Zoogloea sp.]|uniref:hypothetical protein n=1 Tax=Zoogloea sp. TaxID=49181 RepID=UPI0026362262|nr:hypothetical protein [Zoogloea sp.]MDD3328151.1 hypothetical protein [Zoogloea sp.]